jgi:hypothetical protein
MTVFDHILRTEVIGQVATQKPRLKIGHRLRDSDAQPQIEGRTELCSAIKTTRYCLNK